MTAPYLSRFGSRSLILSSALFAAWTVFAACSGTPVIPLTGWVDDHRAVLAWADEALMFAALTLVPGAVAFALRGWSVQPRTTVVGLTALGAGVVFLLTADLALGRLVYPVFGLVPTEAELAASVGAYYGALHAFDLAAAVAVGALGWAVRKGRGRWWLVLSAAAVLTELASAYPWLYGPDVGAALRVPLVVWLAAALGSPAERR